MYPTRRATPLLVSAALLFALVGCASGTGGADGTGSTGGAVTPGDDAGTTPASCIADRTWVLDTDDLAAQLAANMTANGMTVAQSEASGRQTVEFNSDGSATAFVDVTYTLTVDDGTGLVITLVQTHAGEPRGEWELLADGTTLTFSGWDSAGYTIQNTVLIDGVAVDMPIDVPSESFGDTDMATECSGNTLTTKVAVSPFTSRWSAES